MDVERLERKYVAETSRGLNERDTVFFLVEPRLLLVPLEPILHGSSF